MVAHGLCKSLTLPSYLQRPLPCCNLEAVHIPAIIYPRGRSFFFLAGLLEAESKIGGKNESFHCSLVYASFVSSYSRFSTT
jgi:hypothetical protein